jgi:hypothetical protein
LIAARAAASARRHPGYYPLDGRWIDLPLILLAGLTMAIGRYL